MMRKVFCDPMTSGCHKDHIYEDPFYYHYEPLEAGMADNDKTEWQLPGEWPNATQWIKGLGFSGADFTSGLQWEGSKVQHDATRDKTGAAATSDDIAKRLTIIEEIIRLFGQPTTKERMDFFADLVRFVSGGK